MGKRTNCLSVKFNDKDVRITKHAMIRYRQRVLRIPTRHSDLTRGVADEIAVEVAPMIAAAVPIIRSRPGDSMIYLACGQFTFAMTHDGVIVTVLIVRDGHSQFASSIKEHRKSKRSQLLESKRLRYRRLRRQRREEQWDRNIERNFEDLEENE